MGQVLRAMTYDRDTEDAIPALEINGTPLAWFHLDDGVMGGKSVTRLSVKDDNKSLHIQGTIDTHASVGWASARASLPEGLPSNTSAIQVQVCGDGKTYKVLLHDNNHESRFNKTPLWEADLVTKAGGASESVTIPLASFVPSFMGTQVDASEKAKYPLNPASLTKIGFMLSSRLSDGSKNPTKTYGEGTFAFSLIVESLKTVVGGEPKL